MMRQLPWRGCFVLFWNLALLLAQPSPSSSTTALCSGTAPTSAFFCRNGEWYASELVIPLGTSLNLTVPASIDGDVVVAVGATLHLAHRLALFGDFTLQRGATLSLSADAFLGVGSFLNVSDGALIEFSLLDRQLRAITTANCVHLSGTLRIHVHSEKAVTTTVLSYACRIGEFTSLESVTDDPCWPNHEEAHYSDFDLVVSTVPYYRCDPPSLLPGITYQPALALVIVLALIAAVIFVAVTFVLFRALYNKVEKMQIEERHQESEKRQAKIAALKRRLSSRFSLDPDVLAPYV